MQWHQIIGFYNLIKLGNFTKAAEAVHRTQSALTQQLKGLERELDCKLTKRVGRGQVIATSEGQELFQFAEKMLREQREVIERIQTIRDEAERTLVIAAPIDTMSKVIPKYIKQFRESRPDIKLRLIECSLDEVVTGVRSQDFDLGLGVLTYIPSDFTQIRWLPMHHYIIANRNHDIWKSTIDLTSISKCNLILPPITEYAQTGGVLTSALSTKGLPCNILLEASSNDRCIEYACSSNNLFFGLCSDEMVKNLPKSARSQNLKHLFRSDNIGIFYDSTRKLRPRDKQFLEILGLLDS